MITRRPKAGNAEAQDRSSNFILIVYNAILNDTPLLYFNLEMMASVYWEVEAFPPKSPVMALPSAMVCGEKNSVFRMEKVMRSRSSQRRWRFLCCQRA
jgi:hypothetical protein